MWQRSWQMSLIRSVSASFFCTALRSLLHILFFFRKFKGFWVKLLKNWLGSVKVEQEKISAFASSTYGWFSDFTHICHAVGVAHRQRHLHERCRWKKMCQEMCSEVVMRFEATGLLRFTRQILCRHLTDMLYGRAFNTCFPSHQLLFAVKKNKMFLSCLLNPQLSVLKMAPFMTMRFLMMNFMTQPSGLEAFCKRLKGKVLVGKASHSVYRTRFS